MRKRLFAFLGLVLAVVLLAACGETTKKHKVTFDVNGGTPAIAAVEVEEGKLVAKPADPTKAGYTFAGWYLGDAAWNFETDKVTKPITLVAKWDEQGPTLYTVTFNTDGGRPLIDSEEVPAGEKVLKPARIPYKEHYVFKGWYVGNEEFDFENTAINSDITITAKWEKMAEVVFDVRGGSAIDPLYVEKGKKVTKPEDPTREGYNFLGWLLGYNGQAYDFDAVVEDDLVLVASWGKKEYVTITLIADGGEPAPESPVQHEKGTVFAKPAEMTREGYEFVGWFNQITDEEHNFSAPVDENLILIAKWTRVYANYTVTFDIGYEGGEEIDAQTVQEEDKATEPTIEDRIGYRFMGWFEEGATEPYDFDAMVLRDLHLVAQWHLEHVVTFDIGYAEGTNPAPVLVLDGDKVSAPSIAAREFYQFDGWFLGEATEPFDFAETPITETIHLVARWTELETYEITYHNTTDDMFVYGTKEAMVEAFLLDFYDFVKSPFSISDFMHGPGKTSGFDGLWNEANDKIYGGPRPEPGAYNDTYFVSSYKYMDKWLPFFDMIHEFVLIVNPTQFFFGDGVWTGRIRLHQYICNIRPGGNETAEDMYMMPDPLISNPPVKQHLGTDAIQLLEPYREDATFLGWYDNPEFTGEPITEIPANTKEDKNVYAKWDEMARFDVTFDIGYAEGESPATQSVIEGHKATKPADPARRPGYRFEGWFEDAAEEPFNFDNPITAAVALTAKWREVTEYQVTFDYNTPNVEDVILWLEDGELIVEPAEPAREGYRFLGWYEGEAENPYNFTVAPTADTVLTAKWEIYTIYTITYNVPAEAEVVPGFAERNEMVDAFLTDFYNFLVSEEVIDGTAISLSDYMHGTGKTEGYDGIYASNDHGALKLYGVVEGFANLEVQPETGLFINQVEYNKWVPLMLLWEEYVSKGNPDQSMLGNASVPGSPSLIQYRLKPFLQGKNLWSYAADIILPILATIPKEYAAAKYEYTLADGEFYLPQAIHATKEFIGWYDNEELTGDPIELVAEGTTGNLVFYGAFGTRYNVEYHLGYDELQLPKAVVLEGNLVPNKEVEPRHLYKFLGWALQGETELFDFETIITEDIVLVAQWEALEALTVTFDLGYEGAPLPEEVEVGKGTAVAKPTPDPIREGYIFGGWYLGEATDPYDFATLVEANMTLTARWEEYYTITFNLGEGGYLSNEDLIAHVDNNHIVATRYSNAGDSTGKPIMVGPNSGVYWHKIALKDTATPGVYEVIDKGGGSSYSLPTETTLVVAYHDSVAGDYAAAIKAIYASIEAGALVLIPELPAAYASETVIDIYFLSGALPTEVVVISNEITELITPLREGYNFVNWYDNAELTGEPVTVIPENIEANLTLYAKWEAKVYHTVTFDLGYEGAPAATEEQVLDGAAVAEPEDPVREGYVFLGWYVGVATDPYDFATLVEADLTLTARWEEEVVLPSIDEVRNLDVDTDVEFVGVVTGFTDYSTEYSNYDKVFVEDSTGAIVVYRAAFPADLKIGDKFLIVGKLGQYNGLIQIAQGATVTLIDSDNDLILPVEVTNVAEINEDFQAKRIDLEGTVVSVSANGQTMVVKVGENEITVRSNSSSNAHIVNAHLLTAVIGQEVNLNGIHVDWFNGAQLLPTTVEQIVFVELSDEMKVADAKANLIVPSIVATEEISLPTEGLHGTVITWASSNETIIATDGTVVLPTEETEVTLTATITLGEVTDTKEFLVTVFPLGSEPQILNQSDFGETDGWGNYGERTDQAIEHGEEDPNPSGNSSWDLNGGNVNNTGWDYIRMGGKAASTKEGLEVYLKTNFTFEVEIKEIIIDIVGLDSASGNETIWLQTSTDGESWTDVTSKEITAVGDLVFDNLTIASGNYFRFVIVRGSTSSNKGTDIKTITFKG